MHGEISWTRHNNPIVLVWISCGTHGLVCASHTDPSSFLFSFCPLTCNCDIPLWLGVTFVVVAQMDQWSAISPHNQTSIAFMSQHLCWTWADLLFAAQTMILIYLKTCTYCVVLYPILHFLFVKFASLPFPQCVPVASMPYVGITVYN